MTSLAFILGVVPLAIATGASAASQNAIGTGVLGGMITATVLAVFFVPVFFVFVTKLFGRGKAQRRTMRLRPTPLRFRRNDGPCHAGAWFKNSVRQDTPWRIEGIPALN